MNKNDKFHGLTPEMNPNAELSDDELESVSGGIPEEDLKAFWAVGGSGVPLCPQHGGKQAYMKSYWKNGKVHLECTECGYIRVVH